MSASKTKKEDIREQYSATRLLGAGVVLLADGSLVVRPLPSVTRPEHPSEEQRTDYLAARLERHHEVGQALVDTWMTVSGHGGSMADAAAYIKAGGRDAICAAVLADLIHVYRARGIDPGLAWERALKQSAAEDAGGE